MPPTATAPLERHNVYNDEDFVRPEPSRGTVRDATGRRLVRASADLLAALTAALDREGANAADVLYKLGRQWGEADFKAFAARAPREFGVSGLEQMHFQVMLESWRWPLTASGWGVWRYDFRRARVGLPVVDLSHSAVVDAAGKAKTPVCHLYAGLFAAVFSTLAKRDLKGMEIQCAATGADGCRFLIASAAKAGQAAKLRDEGLSAEDLLDRLTPAPAESSKEKAR
jgi:predicted hydrocarbon binding protein